MKQVVEKRKKEMWQMPVPLGISLMGERVCFAAEVPALRKSCETVLTLENTDVTNVAARNPDFVNTASGKPADCTLLLYKKGKTEPEEYEMHPVPYQGTICAVTLPVSKVKGALYQFCIAGKHMVDPYATLVSGNEAYGQVPTELKGAIRLDFPDFSEDVAPNRPFSEIILYKLHVRGFTMHETSGVRKKGTYAGAAEKIPHLKDLGINAVLLMPCTEFVEVSAPAAPLGYSKEFLQIYRNLPEAQKNEEILRKQAEEIRRVNYWGYQAESYYFAPKASYAYTKNPMKEFAEMVKAFHKAGILVFMELGFPQQIPSGLILDCLRFWTLRYHIDGFRIFGEHVPYQMIATDPYLGATKIIADAEDIWKFGEIKVREADFGELQSVKIGVYDRAFAWMAKQVLSGISVYEEHLASYLQEKRDGCVRVCYLTDNDGSTLYDLYAYPEQPVPEDESFNPFFKIGGENGAIPEVEELDPVLKNTGESGPNQGKDEAGIILQKIKDSFRLLLETDAVPLIYAGDECLNSQNGNRNAYNQDNEIGYVIWKEDAQALEIQEHIKHCIALRKQGIAAALDKQKGAEST